MWQVHSTALRFVPVVHLRQSISYDLFDNLSRRIPDAAVDEDGSMDERLVYHIARLVGGQVLD